ncbi:ABC transporter permease [Roseovarius sp. E0-M6]|uniref:ABC transporter permease n=1 Tax=Roseovarius sp. E0-M6 TaxID=3127118 RepID=UPI00300FF63B
MIDTAVRRLLQSIPVLIGVLILGFLLIQLSPGDPARVFAGAMAPPEVVEQIREQMGLDRPMLVQFWPYLERVLQGDLGRSFISNKTVASELGRPLFRRSS